MVNATSNTTTTSARLTSGIYVSAGTNTISNNTVHNLSNANANNTITNTASVSGIVIANATAAVQTVSGNTVYNLSNSYASFTGGVIGIYYSGSTTASAVKANFIHSLSVSASSTTADLYGIKIAAGATTYSNNIISLGGNTTTDLFGIYETGIASNNNNLYFNTINISGSLSTGANNVSYALFSAVITNTRSFYNNIFVNTRSTVSGTSKHFAMYIVTSGGTITCNYNNYYASGTGGVLGYYGANKTALPIVTSNDGNSIITNPTFSNAGGTTASNYTPTTAGVALNTTGINVDYAGNIRATNVTMGAYELKLGPDAPTDVVVTDRVGRASIAFTAPTNIGGGAISNYQYSLDNGSSWVTPSPAITASPLLITGLVNCTAYSTKIRAVNATGAGTASTTATVTPQNGQQAGNWTSRSPAEDKYWSSVTYGNGLFVAVSFDYTTTRVMTSSDGITWMIRTPPVYFGLEGVTYGNGTFVAVASYGVNNNQVLTSLDGITWAQRTSAAKNDWKGVTYANGLFVAVAYSGTGNRVMTSSDGITWASKTSAADNNWTSVTYGKNLFVAVAASGFGNRVMTSPDGITWTSRTSAADNNWYSVTYGNGLFVAVANSGVGNRVMTSDNGINWTSRTIPIDNNWVSVTYGNGLFVAVATSGTGNRVMTSVNGIDWTIRTSAANNNWQGVTYGNGLFVAVSNNGTGNRVMTSADAFAPSSPSINTITPRNTYATVAFTAPTSSGYSAITNYQYSTDNGSTWVTPSSAVTASPLTIRGLTSGTTYPIQLRAVNSMGAGCGSTAVSATTIIPIAPNEPTIVVATAGVNAANIAFTTPTNDGGADITYEYSINNGSSWTAIASTSSPLYIGGLTACTNYTIKIRAVNAAGVGTSSAAVSVTPQNGNQIGITWTSRTSASDNYWSSVTYGNGLFVAVATAGTDDLVMTSPDGINWTSRTPAEYEGWSSVTYGNGLFVAVAYSGTGNRVMTSDNGIDWTSRTSAAANSCWWSSVTYGNGLFVAVGRSGIGNRVMTSDNGIDWTIRTSVPDNYFSSVTYGNGLFVAVATSVTGTGNRVMTSPDGITWTSRTSAANNDWYGVTYGNGLFVAVSPYVTGTQVMTSSDLFAPSSPSINSITPSNTTASVAFTAPASAGSTAITNYQYSTDNGSTWVTRSPVATTSPLVISNLTYGSTYQVQLRAVNSVGSSCGSASMSTTIATTLPVNITHLQASKQQLGVNLEWKAENELSVEKYIVERSANGINFETIGSTKAIGNSGATIDYHFFDALPLNGNNYYRIKSIDKSGAFLFTNIVVINLNTFVTGISVYPNPITTGSFMLKLQGMAAGQYGIQLFTNQGQQVLFKEIKHLGGSSTIKMHLPSGLSAGMYFIRYTKNNVVLKNEQLIID